MSEESPLSPRGRARREEILGEMQRGARRARVRRRVVDVGGATLVVVVAGVAAWMGTRPVAKSPADPRAGDRLAAGDGRGAAEHADAAVDSGAVASGEDGGWASVISVVSTDRGVAERMTLSGSGNEVARISDDELLRLLDEAGAPAGIVRRDGRLELVPVSGARVEPSAPVPASVS